MPTAIRPNESRTPEQLRRHYEIECALARKLRAATAEERVRLYGEVYEELVNRLPDQPMYRQSEDPAGQAQSVALQSTLLDPFLSPATRFLELGAGDASLAKTLAPRVAEAIVVDANRRLLDSALMPPNITTVHGDATRIELASESVDLSYSCHFLEHLHPDDAPIHLTEVLRVLKPGGVYVLVTPNRLWGPHDISRYFDDEPCGLHLREYTYGELTRLLRQVGFGRIAALRGVGRPPRIGPILPLRVVEGAFAVLPAGLRLPVLTGLFRRFPEPVRPLEQVKIAAWKDPVSPGAPATRHR